MKIYYPEGSDQDLYILQCWVRSNIETRADIDRLIESLSKESLRVDRVLHDILLVLSITGLNEVVNRKENYYFTVERTEDVLIHDIHSAISCKR